jgi:catechol 2,3-dioxygenase-like lactoylglutathione lyase family enzyme
MIDHITIEVSDYETSRDFYEKALAPLNYQLLMEIAEFAGFGDDDNIGPIAPFWIKRGKAPSNSIHFAFTTNSREVVRQFYDEAIKAGGKDNGLPGIRTAYHPNYYAAFILDPDGYNVEVVCHEPEDN